MPFRAEPRLAGAGAHELASVSSFGEAEPLRLPFDLQRRHLFLLAVAVVAMVVVAAGAGVSPLIGAGLVVAIALALAVALNEMLGLVLLAALVPATAGLAKGVPLPGVRLSEAVAGGVGAILLVSARRVVRWTVLDWLALLYALATLVLGGWDQLHGSNHFGLGQIELLLGPFQFLLLYRATALTAHTPERRRLVLAIVLWASVPVALLAIGQQFNLPAVRSLLVSLTHNNVYAPGQTARVTGPFPLWHNLAGYLFMVLLVIAALLIRRVSGVLSRPVLIGIAVVDAVALLETLSIAPIVGVIAGVAIIGIWHRGLGRVMVALVAMLVIGLLVFGGRIDARYASEFNQAPGETRSALVPQTVQYRYDLWTNQLLPLLKGHALTGYGPDLPSQLQNFPFTESLYINLLYKGGVILLVAWIALFVAMGLASLKSTRDRDPLQQALGAAVVAAIVCLIFMQALESDFTDDGMPQVLWMLLGLLAFREVAATVVTSPVRSALEEARRERAWAGNVAMSLQGLDPGSRELLTLSYHHGLDDDEVVGVMGLSPRAIAGWRRSALNRLAVRTHMSPASVEQVLRSGDGGSG
jgi:O-antigen ligase